MKSFFLALALMVTTLISTNSFAQYYDGAQSRVQSVKGWQFALGAAYPLSDAYPEKDTHYAFGFGYAWGIDNAFIEARTDIMNRFASPAQYYSAFTLGGNYIFHNTDLIGLFAGGNFGLGFGESHDDSAGGFHFGADVGFLFLRQADVNLDARFRFMTSSAKHGDKRPVWSVFMLGIHM